MRAPQEKKNVSAGKLTLLLEETDLSTLRLEKCLVEQKQV